MEKQLLVESLLKALELVPSSEVRSTSGRWR